MNRREFSAGVAGTVLSSVLPVRDGSAAPAYPPRWSDETSELFHVACTIKRHSLYSGFLKGFCEGIPHGTLKPLADADWRTIMDMRPRYPAAREARRAYLETGALPTIP